MDLPDNSSVAPACTASRALRATAPPACPPPASSSQITVCAGSLSLSARQRLGRPAPRREVLRPVRRRLMQRFQVGGRIDGHRLVQRRLAPGLRPHEQPPRPALAQHLVDVAAKARVARRVVRPRGIVAHRVLHQRRQRHRLLLLRRVLDPEHERRQRHRREPRVQRRKRAERRQLHLHRQLRVPEAQLRHRVFARHLDLLHPRPVRPAGRLEQPGRAARADQEMQRHLAHPAAC